MSPVFGTACDELKLGMRVTTSSRTDCYRKSWNNDTGQVNDVN